MRILETTQANGKLLYFTWSNSDKDKYYFKKASLKFDEAEYICMSRFMLYNYLRAITKFSLESCRRVYLGSVGGLFFQYILSIIKFEELRTYDDGIGNVFIEGEYFKPQNHSLLKNMLYKAIGGRYSLEAIKKESKKHFTIFKGPNAFRNCEYLDIFRNKDAEPVYGDKVIRIFLGQPREGALTAIDVEQALKQLFNYLNIDLYLPHPRESQDFLNGLRVDTAEIAEDYIDSLLKTGHYEKIEVYSFYSTSLLTLSGHESICCTAIRFEGFHTDSLYELFKENGVKVLNYKELIDSYEHAND